MYDFIIVGGGIVGLATGYALKKNNAEASILILEKESQVACHQTGRNSGVIHSGVYYKPGSLKAALTSRGNKRMFDFCRHYGIKYEQCGKVIVASNADELPYLDTLAKRGGENGLNVKKLNREELREIEPHVEGVAALHVPEAGIVSYKKVSEILLAELLRMGSDIAYNARVNAIHAQSDQCYVHTEKTYYESQFVINCAGLHSDTLAAQSGLKLQHRIIPFRGEYFELTSERRCLVKNLIYPVPDPSFPFLGVHFTRMIDGSVHAGPNAVLSLKKEGYSKFAFDAFDAWKTLTYSGSWRLAGRHWRKGGKELYRSISKTQFVHSLQKLIPQVQADDLIPADAGVRAQALNSDGTLVDDFLIRNHGRSIHVCNAPSPAATASLEIGDTIARHVMNIHKTKTIQMSL